MINSVMNKFNVVCHTDGCENKDIVILVDADGDEPTVICGVCSQPITDVTKK